MRRISRTRTNQPQAPQLQHQLPLKQVVARKTIRLRPIPGTPGARIKKKLKEARKLLLNRAKIAIIKRQLAAIASVVVIFTDTLTDIMINGTGCSDSTNLRIFKQE